MRVGGWREENWGMEVGEEDIEFGEGQVEREEEYRLDREEKIEMYTNIKLSDILLNRISLSMMTFVGVDPASYITFK